MSDERCISCGACCQFAVVPPFEPEEIKAISPQLREPIERVWSHAANPDANFWDQLGTRVCSWFNSGTGECRHYDRRPAACRDFVVGSTECGELRIRAGVDNTTELTIGASDANSN